MRCQGPLVAAALPLKILLYSKQCDDDGLGSSNPDYVRDAEAYGVCAARGSAQFYRDAVGLAALAA